MRFADILPSVERAYAATRLVIQGTGCQLGASLLTLDLDRQGVQAEYVRGYYSGSPEQEHGWVEAEDMLLDPTRDQFSEDPFAEHYTDAYERVEADPPARWSARQPCTCACRGHSNRRAWDAIAQVVAQNTV